MQKLVKVKKKFNVTIPKNLRKKLPLKVGQLIEMELENGRIILKPVAVDPSDRLDEIMGKIKLDDLAKQGEEVFIKEARASLAKKLGRR